MKLRKHKKEMNTATDAIRNGNSSDEILDELKKIRRLLESNKEKKSLLDQRIEEMRQNAEEIREYERKTGRKLLPFFLP